VVFVVRQIKIAVRRNKICKSGAWIIAFTDLATIEESGA